MLTPKKHVRKSLSNDTSLSSYSRICNTCFSGNSYAIHFLSLLYWHLGDPKTLSSMPEPSGKEGHLIHPSSKAHPTPAKHWALFCGQISGQHSIPAV